MYLHTNKMTESTKECMISECMQSECMQSECTICLLNYNEETKKITECCHTFHTECLDRWLQNNTSCPLCRTELKPMSFSSGSVVADLIHDAPIQTFAQFQLFANELFSLYPTSMTRAELSHEEEYTGEEDYFISNGIRLPVYRRNQIY